VNVPKRDADVLIYILYIVVRIDCVDGWVLVLCIITTLHFLSRPMSVVRLRFFVEYVVHKQATAFKLDFLSMEIWGPSPDLAAFFRAAKAAHIDTLIVVANPLVGQSAKQVFELATQYRLPSMTEERRYVDAGGLISYGASLSDLYRRAAEYVVDILKGAKAGDLQVKLPEKFEIFVNLKTAKEVGVTIPQHVLLQADKIIK